MIVNIVIIAVIAVICFFAVKATIDHFKGKGSCCGGGSSTVLVEPKPLKEVAAVKTITIEGMKCENCSARIQNELNSLEGVNAKVNHKKGFAEVKTGPGVTDQLLKETVEKAGYTVVKIEDK